MDIRNNSLKQNWQIPYWKALHNFQRELHHSHFTGGAMILALNASRCLKDLPR